MTLLFRWTIPIAYFAAASTVALTLLLILGRSPNTRLNVVEEPGTYDRTAIAVVGGTQSFLGVAETLTGSTREQYIRAGCANCHGLDGAGGAVGPDIRSTTSENLDFALREGVPGMPTFQHDRITAQQAQAILQYVNDLAPPPDEDEQPEQASVPDASEQ